MNNALTTIVNAIPSDRYFDSHYVIETLIRNHGDTYFHFLRASNQNTTALVHRDISALIQQFVPHLVTDTMSKSHSYNIREHATPCRLWKKV